MMEFTIEQGVLKGCQGDAAIVEIPEGVREIGYGHPIVSTPSLCCQNPSSRDQRRS